MPSSDKQQPVAKGKVITVDNIGPRTRIEIELNPYEEGDPRIHFEDWVEVKTTGRLVFETWNDDA